MGLPSVIEDKLIFTFDDPQRSLTRVSLYCDDAIEGRRRFRRTSAGWTLSVPRPELNRVEYRLVVSARGGGTTVVCDPDNSERVDTAFGERSVALMPGYERPRWVQREATCGEVRELVHDDDVIGALPIVLWNPAGLADSEPAPLLVVHDGPEYDRLSQLSHYTAAMVETGSLAPFRMALMQPVERDEWYAANDDYVAAELAAVDLIAETVTIVCPLAVMGASLGGLTALLVALAAGERVGAVFAQSGSFFDPELDSQESSYPLFEQVTAAVESLAQQPTERKPLFIGMTCGLLEENWANNEAMAARLREVGHHVKLTPLDDLHNYTAWRDGLDPGLTDVLRAVWGDPRMAT